MIKERIAIIGAGHIGACLLTGLVAAGLPKENLLITDPKKVRLDDIKDRLGVECSTDNSLALQSDIVVLALRPNDILAALKRLPPTNTLFISLAAGRSLRQMKAMAGPNIIRAMPNLPIVVNSGITALVAAEECTPKQKKLAEALMRCVGETVWLENEDQIHPFTALCGSSPALVMRVCQAFEDHARASGFNDKDAQFLVRQMLFGTSKLLLTQESTTSTLINSVCVSGGVTEAMLKNLDVDRMEQIIKKSLQQGVKKSENIL